MAEGLRHYKGQDPSPSGWRTAGEFFLFLSADGRLVEIQISSLVEFLAGVLVVVKQQRARRELASVSTLVLPHAVLLLWGYLVAILPPPSPTPAF